MLKPHKNYPLVKNGNGVVDDEIVWREQYFYIMGYLCMFLDDKAKGSRKNLILLERGILYDGRTISKEMERRVRLDKQKSRDASYSDTKREKEGSCQKKKN